MLRHLMATVILLLSPKMGDSYTCSVYSHEDNFEVHCRGKGLREIPKNLNISLNRLIISETRNISVIFSHSFEPYKDRLQDVTLSDLPGLRVIQDGAFADTPHLRTIYIYNAPQIKIIYGLLKGVISTEFRILRIVNTGLHEVPELSYLPPENTLSLLDLDHNKIETLYSNALKVSAHQVTLNFNEISLIEDHAFNGSQIGKLDITSNPTLTNIAEFAFSGLENLRELDLSKTSIKTLPYFGLSNLEVLKIREVSTLHTIPSLYDLKSLKYAKLTHHFHCCAFKYPKQHAPTKHEAYRETMRQVCIESEQSDQYDQKQKRSLDYRTSTMQPLVGNFIESELPEFNDESSEDLGTFHSTSTEINYTSIEIFCGNISFNLPHVQCTPEPDALNPCEDIMGFNWLRNSVWFVVILAVVGNVAVVIVVWFSDTEISVSRFLICNLALADLCMGFYLLLLAAVDYKSVGTYFNFAFTWQYGIGCQIAGFLTVFAGHLSIFTLTVVTLERWFAIKYAIDLTKRIRLGTAVQIMIAGWIYSILMALLPLLGVNSYSSTSICLPMKVTSTFDTSYLYAIFLINGFSLGLIVFCYAQIYFSLGIETRRATHKGEMTLARKFALLIFIDFATYTPVAFFGMCALIGYPFIDITKSKILLVFFYPLNACANPYLYALTTSQYRRDLSLMLSKCGMCQQRAQHYLQKDDIPLSKRSPVLTRPCCNNNCPTLL